MYRSSRPFLMLALLVAIGLRTVLGAPCCVDPASAALVIENAGHAHHSEEEGHDHSEHGEGASVNPCCSACGPTLPPEPALIALVRTPRALPEPAAIRALATRPPYPAYDATGPPLLT